MKLIDLLCALAILSLVLGVISQMYREINDSYTVSLNRLQAISDSSVLTNMFYTQCANNDCDRALLANVFIESKIIRNIETVTQKSQKNRTYYILSFTINEKPCVVYSGGLQ